MRNSAELFPQPEKFVIWEKQLDLLHGIISDRNGWKEACGLTNPHFSHFFFSWKKGCWVQKPAICSGMVTHQHKWNGWLGNVKILEFWRDVCHHHNVLFQYVMVYLTTFCTIYKTVVGSVWRIMKRKIQQWHQARISGCLGSQIITKSTPNKELR